MNAIEYKYEYKMLDERARIMIKNCYKTYISNAENNIAQNPKLFWSFVKAKKVQSSVIPTIKWSGNNTASTGEEISNQFATHFSSTFIPSNKSTASATFLNLR